MARLLAEPGLAVVVLADADEALEALGHGTPAVVLVDARRPDEDAPLLLGLLRRRHPRQPVITLMPGLLRVFDGQKERVEAVQDGTAEALHHLLGMVREAAQELLAWHLVQVLRMPTGQA